MTMKKAMLAVALMVMVATPVSAQDPAVVAFVEVVTTSDIGASLNAWGSDPLGSEPRERFRTAIQTDREALAAITPTTCLLPIYVGYLEALMIGEVTLALFEAMELKAAAQVQMMVGQKFQSIDGASIADCV
jgi:hypothetical protein